MENVLYFIRELALNNNKEWFDDNRLWWNECKETIHIFTADLIKEMSLLDDGLKVLRVKDCLWRINRDIRFSHDKSLYKSWIGIFLCPGGKKSGNAGYYFHIDGFPEGDAPNMLYAGLHLPQPKVLKGVRNEIVACGDEFERCIAGAEGFILDRSQSLARNPAGFPKGSPHEELLRLNKDIGLVRKIGDDIITGGRTVERVAAEFSKAVPFVRLLNRVVEDVMTEGEMR